MGGKAPSPPKLEAPKPTPQEIALQQEQVRAQKQAIRQSETLFQQGQSDRLKALDLFETIRSPQKLSPDEEGLINQITEAYFDQAVSSLTDGPGADLFNREVSGTIANLADRGVLGGTTGQRVLGDLFGRQQSEIAGIGQQAALQGLLLRKGQLDQNLARDTDLFRSFLTGSSQSTALGNALGQSGSAIAQNVINQLQQQRANEFNVQAQNAQAQYLTDLQNFNRKQRITGSIIGGIGTLAGGIAGAAGLGSLALGGAKLGTIGGGLLGANLGRTITGGFF